MKSTNQNLYNEVLEAAQAAFPNRENIDVVFEHGQWWAVDAVRGGQWSVVDAEGPGTTCGFDFEQVTYDYED